MDKKKIVHVINLIHSRTHIGLIESKNLAKEIYKIILGDGDSGFGGLYTKYPHDDGSPDSADFWKP